MAANPNTLTADFPYFWSKRQQVVRGKLSVYKDIASFEEQTTLKKGERVYRPYRSALIVKTLGGDGSYSRQALTDTEEHLDIDQEKEVSFYVKRPDEVQSNYAIATSYADDAMKRSDEFLDGLVLGEYDHAGSVVGNYEVAASGSASDGIGFTLTTSNILTVFGKINRKLDRKHIPARDRWGIISPEFRDVLWQFIAGRESMLGDKVGTNPNEIGTYAGFRLFVSENNGWSARLEMATIATDTDTVTINGVVFTADEDGGAVGAGHFSIQGSATLCCGQLADAINNSEEYEPSVGAVDTYIEITAANRAKLAGISAVFTAGNEYLELKGQGVGYIVVSEGLSAAANIWTTTKQLQHNLFGQGKPIDLVVQKYPSLEIKDRSGYIGKDFVTWFLAGIKTFAEGADALVDVQIRSDSF
jgi:hypothetical protein